MTELTDEQKAEFITAAIAAVIHYAHSPSEANRELIKQAMLDIIKEDDDV